MKKMRTTRTKTNCPDCGSSDALQYYEDHTYCFSCRKYTNLMTTIKGTKEIRPIPEEILMPLIDRGISLDAAKKFKVTYLDNAENTFVHVYPYTRKGKHVANKLRLRAEKDFRFEGDSTKLDLFGQSAFPAGCAKAITIVEGECDAMAAYQMNGGFPVVSVRSSSQALSDIKNNFEYLNSFDEIVICFDKDEAKHHPDGSTHYPGQEAALEVAGVFPVGKVRILTLSEHKDPNDYLQAGKSNQFKKEWWGAARYTPAGIKLGTELWDAVINPPKYETTYYPFQGLNDKTYGLRLSEMVIVNAQPKIGKSTILGEITYHILRNTEDAKVGLMRLEESNRDTALNLMSIHANKRLHLPDVWDSESPEDIKKYFDEVVNTERVVLWDHFGSNSIDAVLNQMRQMSALGCKYIILDHLSIIVSDQSGDERKQLDELATKIKTLCMELNVCVLAVVHQNRNGEIRGTQGIEQLANIVIKLERDKLDPNEFIRNCMSVTVTENRFCGETGIANYLYYDLTTGRLREVSEDDYMAAKLTGQAPWSI